jgi:hypothetical protein
MRRGLLLAAQPAMAVENRGAEAGTVCVCVFGASQIRTLASHGGCMQELNICYYLQHVCPLLQHVWAAGIQHMH